MHWIVYAEVPWRSRPVAELCGLIFITLCWERKICRRPFDYEVVGGGVNHMRGQGLSWPGGLATANLMLIRELLPVAGASLYYCGLFRELE